MNSHITYRRACSAAGNCVEVGAATDGTVNVRDSKNPSAEPHQFTKEEWSAFVTAVRAGEFGFDT